MAAAEAVAVAAAVVVAVVTDMFCNNYSRLLLQFHITGRCNLRCKHCYREDGDVENLTFDQVADIINQFKILLKKYNSINNVTVRGHINITGGEPFIRSDIKKILELLGENKKFFTYGILSNGSFIDEEIISLLKSTEVSFVQLSIDGDRKTHDYLRAEGDYDRVFSVAEKLEENGIKTYISFTANKENFKFLPIVAKECRKRKITKLWSDRLVPIGNGEDLKNLAITKEDLLSYVSYLKKASGNIVTRKLYPKTTVTKNRALQFQNTDGEIYSCSAGRSLITVDEFGNILPCRRMPLVCGNVLKENLSDVYFNNEVFVKLRMNSIPEECISCKYSYKCRGGAKCQSYALFNSFYKKDPACPLK